VRRRREGGPGVLAAVLVVAACTGSGREGETPRFGFGREPSPELLAAMDIDVRPDGKGLPEGSGTVARGREVFALHCVACHGPTGTEGPFDRLVGRDPREGFPFGEKAEYLGTRTVGNYWPYATTLFDYIRRAMPQTAPGSLGADDTYAVIAYILHLNEIVPEDAVLDARSLPDIEMPARDRFVPDDRAGGQDVR